MKRSVVLKLLEETIADSCTVFNPSVAAENCLKTLELLGIVDPTHKVTISRMCMLGGQYDDEVTVKGWERER
jgi:hypothetical protein